LLIVDKQIDEYMCHDRLGFCFAVAIWDFYEYI